MRRNSRLRLPAYFLAKVTAYRSTKDASPQSDQSRLRQLRDVPLFRVKHVDEHVLKHVRWRDVKSCIHHARSSALTHFSLERRHCRIERHNDLLQPKPLIPNDVQVRIENDS